MPVWLVSVVTLFAIYPMPWLLVSGGLVVSVDDDVASRFNMLIPSLLFCMFDAVF
jgi:hypothetical protein